MSLPAETKTRYTIAEYLQQERDSEEKHEYMDGQIVSMAGGTRRHSLISANIVRALGNRLEDKPCRVYESNLRIRIPRKVLYTYPDATVICGKDEADPDDTSGETLTNPTLLVEVLSPSTKRLDRIVKFARYRTIETFKEYVLVSQDEPELQSLYRQPDGTWLLTPVIGMEAVAQLRSLQIELPLREVFAKVEFPPEPAATP